MRGYGRAVGVLALCFVLAQLQPVHSSYGGSVRRLGEFGDDVSDWKFGKLPTQTPIFVGLNVQGFFVS